jgi:hypothetical protein
MYFSSSDFSQLQIISYTNVKKLKIYICNVKSGLLTEHFTSEIFSYGLMTVGFSYTNESKKRD